MRRREYLSPSAIALWDTKGDEAFYMKYLSDVAIEKEPQTQPMSIGSAFDAYVKSYLHERLFGKGHDPQFEFTTIFEKQVEKHNRDWALVHGGHCFKLYEKCGALADLFVDLSQASSEPKFEFEVKGKVKHKTMDTKGLVLSGKPDCYFIHKSGHPIVLDWKINGWCGKGNTSPCPGYIRIRHTDGTSPKSIMHKDCILGTKRGVTVNTNRCLERVNSEWAGQLSVYGWLSGEEVGNDFITMIHQGACKYTGGFPEVRFAEHSTWVSSEYQHSYLENAANIWEIIQSDHLLRSLSFEESQVRCNTLDNYTATSANLEDTEERRMFKQMTKGPMW